jgi:hypothetical protein
LMNKSIPGNTVALLKRTPGDRVDNTLPTWQNKYWYSVPCN